jgi:hypothetical protein
MLKFEVLDKLDKSSEAGTSLSTLQLRDLILLCY